MIDGSSLRSFACELIPSRDEVSFVRSFKGPHPKGCGPLSFRSSESCFDSRRGSAVQTRCYVIWILAFLRGFVCVGTSNPYRTVFLVLQRQKSGLLRVFRYRPPLSRRVPERLDLSYAQGFSIASYPHFWCRLWPNLSHDT